MKIELKVLNKEFYGGISQEDKLLGKANIRQGYKLPEYATPGSAGIDLICTEDVTIYPQETKIIPTGLAIWIGSANMLHNLCVMGMIVPRSGLGTEGLILANTVGVLDSDFQGELKISAWNRLSLDTCTEYFLDDDGDEYEEEVIDKFSNSISLNAGDRIAQLIFVPVIKSLWKVVEEFSSNTDRGEGGFGSTGV